MSKLQPLLQQVARLCCLHGPPCQDLLVSWSSELGQRSSTHLVEETGSTGAMGLGALMLRLQMARSFMVPCMLCR